MASSGPLLELGLDLAQDLLLDLELLHDRLDHDVGAAESVAVGIGDEARFGGVALRLGLELARKQLALRLDALLDLLSRNVLQRHLHAAGDAPAGDVGAHGAGADDVDAGRAPGKLLRRLALQQLRQPEHAAQVPRLVRDHQRRECARLGGLHGLLVAAVALEQIDQAEGRGIVILARLLLRLLAHARGDEAAGRPHRKDGLGETGGLRLFLAQHRLARRPQERAAAVDELIDEAHAARGGSRQHLCRQHGLHGGRPRLPAGSSAPCR